jgi:hypothetical protein
MPATIEMDIAIVGSVERMSPPPLRREKALPGGRHCRRLDAVSESQPLN